jgi:hypothetical protein
MSFSRKVPVFHNNVSPPSTARWRQPTSSKILVPTTEIPGVTFQKTVILIHAKPGTSRADYGVSIPHSRGPVIL